MSAYTHGLQPAEIDDLVETTLHLFEKDKFVDISLPLQHYFAHDDMILQNRVGVQGGDQLQWQVKVRNTGGARNTGMFAVDDVDIKDVNRHAKIGWTKQTVPMAYDIDEPAFNTGDKVRILNMLLTRKHDALSSLVQLMEENFWGMPADPNSEAETRKPFGVPYWFARNQTQGFNGSIPVVGGGAFTSVAGLSPTQYENWRNWTDSYRSIDRKDLVRKMREADRKTFFKDPVPHPQPQSKTPRRCICTTYEVLATMEEILESQNENLGNDVASKDGDAMFRGKPIKWVPYLDDAQDPTGTDTENAYGKNPIIGIDKGSFRCVFQKGKLMRRTKAIIAPNQHSVRHVHWDSWTQFQCYNRRSNWIMYQLV